MRQRWAEAFTERAAAYWTAERIRARLGDKQLLLGPVEAAPLLRALGILKRDASMTPGTLRKYMQINHMVLLLKPLVLDLSRAHGTVRLLDAGCGSSYLTLLLAWCFEKIWRQPALIIGVDRDAQVVQRCKERAALAGLEALLRFEASAIEALDTAAIGPLHGLVSLHACDTATDEALALGVKLEVELLAAAPCCQVELSRKLAALDPSSPPSPLAPLWEIQHLRREAAATLTDMLRTLLLRGCGYRVTPMEFVPSEHTPKNTLLRAMRHGSADLDAFVEYQALRRAIGGVGIRLEEILPAAHRAALGSG